ncbi:hypothetical protein ACU686_26730 [Yinghuangia aomiensis]
MTDTLAPLPLAILSRHLSPAQTAIWLNSRSPPAGRRAAVPPVEALDLVLADVQAENPATLASPGQISGAARGRGSTDRAATPVRPRAATHARIRVQACDAPTPSPSRAPGRGIRTAPVRSAGLPAHRLVLGGRMTQTAPDDGLFAAPSTVPSGTITEAAAPHLPDYDVIAVNLSGGGTDSPPSPSSSNSRSATASRTGCAPTTPTSARWRPRSPSTVSATPAPPNSPRCRALLSASRPTGTTRSAGPASTDTGQAVPTTCSPTSPNAGAGHGSTRRGSARATGRRQGSPRRGPRWSAPSSPAASCAAR